MKQEIVFRILGEGIGIWITRKKNNSEITFIYHHNEFEPIEEGISINEKNSYTTFEKAFELINNSFKWHMLHLDVVHEDYRNFIIKKLIEKLNKNSVFERSIIFSKYQLNEILKIELICKIDNQENPIWSYLPH